MLRFASLAALALATAGCGRETPQAPASEAAGPALAAAAPTAGAIPAIFAQCRSCHAVEAGRNGVGPSLSGVFGRKAAAAPGFAYSAAMTGSGLTWDEATLDRYLTAPLKTVPGGKMVFAGIADPARRAEVIAYLKTLK